ncbi:hypothetical protein CcCBS67573_g06485 [Chytriomyces confervae]|uniref:Glycosyl transferase family 1 domain-containing protein n=1 Tax=Chytriomyces confervae TaxID=246404 RepID=A0A507F2R7_9FUNG|nr:hypothetical protein CcCBS67573_g06485 [Chytriomyces confervae]
MDGRGASTQQKRSLQEAFVVLVAVVALCSAGSIILRASRMTRHDAAVDVAPLISQIQTMDTRFPFAFARGSFARNGSLLLPGANSDPDAAPSDSFTFDQLMQMCHDGTNIAFTKSWAFDSTVTAERDEVYLDSCYGLEITLDQSLRSMGICADAVAYVYHAGARLSSSHSDAVLTSKAANCPKSTYVHTEHLTHVWLTMPNLRNMWMPNIEQISAKQLTYMPRIYQFLCKTKVTCRILGDFIQQNSRNKTFGYHKAHLPTVRYMGHTSPDARAHAKSLNISTKVDFSSFFHAYGSSGRKNTRQVFDCWREHPTWPKLTILGDAAVFNDSLVYDNIEVLNRVNMTQLRRLQVSHGVHICPSEMEGYGHYINEARSLGALVVATDMPPMNEMIDESVNGILITNHSYYNIAKAKYPPKFMSEVRLTWQQVCRGVEKAMQMGLQERARLGVEARNWYDAETALFVENAKTLRKEALYHMFASYTDGGKEHHQDWESQMDAQTDRIVAKYGGSETSNVVFQEE